MSAMTLLIAGIVIILLLVVIGVVISVTSDRQIVEDRLGRYMEDGKVKDGRLPGDASTDAPLPEDRKK